MRVLQALSVSGIVILCCSCATSPANPGLLLTYDKTPDAPPEIVLGVVNGMYRLDPDANLPKIREYLPEITEEEAIVLSSRYMVRVGISKPPLIAILSPVVLSVFSDFVLLPDGWSHDIHTISDNPTVINIGDVLELEMVRGRRFDFARRVLRQCHEPGSPQEGRGFDLGCKTYENFDKRGYAGEKYYLIEF